MASKLKENGTIRYSDAAQTAREAVASGLLSREQVIAMLQDGLCISRHFAERVVDQR